MHGLTGTPYPRSSATALLTFGLRLTRTSSVAEPRCMAASATARPTDPIPTMPAFMPNLLRRGGKPDRDLAAQGACDETRHRAKGRLTAQSPIAYPGQS